MIKPFKSLLCTLALLSLAAPALAAEKGLAVAELFTTQGCSFCPPADKILEKITLENDPDLITLSCHITFMDVPEWKDTLGHTFCNERQLGYSTAMGDPGMALPKIIINGRFDSRGNKEDLVRSAIKMGQAMNTTTRLPLTLKDGALDINLPGMKLEKEAEVWLFAFDNIESVKITGGQNSGETINYVHVVKDMQKIMDWTGGLRSMAFPVTDMPADGYAIIVQYASHGDIIAAGIIEK